MDASKRTRASGSLCCGRDGHCGRTLAPAFLLAFVPAKYHAFRSPLRMALSVLLLVSIFTALICWVIYSSSCTRRPVVFAASQGYSSVSKHGADSLRCAYEPLDDFIASEDVDSSSAALGRLSFVLGAVATQAAWLPLVTGLASASAAAQTATEFANTAQVNVTLAPTSADLYQVRESGWWGRERGGAPLSRAPGSRKAHCRSGVRP